MTEHTCHAFGCDARVPPKMFMCRRHWFALPRRHRLEIWRTYRPGQETDKRASADYLAAAHSAIDWLAAHERLEKSS